EMIGDVVGSYIGFHAGGLLGQGLGDLGGAVAAKGLPLVQQQAASRAGRALGQEGGHAAGFFSGLAAQRKTENVLQTAIKKQGNKAAVRDAAVATSALGASSLLGAADTGLDFVAGAALPGLAVAKGASGMMKLTDTALHGAAKW